MAERGDRLIRRWSALVGLSLTLAGFNPVAVDAQGRDVGIDVQVASDHGVLLIRDVGAGASIIDSPDRLVVVRLARPPSGRPVVALETLRRWLQDITVDNQAMAIRLRPGVEMHRRKGAGGTLALELRDDRYGLPAQQKIIRRTGAKHGAKAQKPPLSIEPAAGPDRDPVVTPAAAEMPMVRLNGPAAVFEREGIVWIASTDSEAPRISELVRGVQVLAPAAGTGGSALRLRLSGLVPVVSRSDEEIRVEFRPGEPPTPVPAHRVDEAGATTLRLHDPDVGDELEVELAHVPHAGSPVAWYASGVELLPSWLGRATRRTSEIASAGARMAHSASAPAIPRPPARRPSARPAHVDPGQVDLADVGTPSTPTAVDEEMHPADSEPPPPLLERQHVLLPDPPLHEGEVEAEDRPVAAAGLRLAGLTELGEAGRAAARRRALAAVAADSKAQAPRLELARLLLADAMATEASAVLEAARRHGQAHIDAPELEAAIAALDARTDDAARLLRVAPKGPEQALWRALVVASSGEPQACLREWERSRQVLWDYPEPLRLRMAVPIARCILDTGRIDVTLAMLDRLEPSLDVASARDRAAALHLRARALGRDGRWPEAQRALDIAIERGDPLTRVQAAFDRAVMAREAGPMSASAAYGELTRQAATWRGHPDEPLMLDRLARMAEEAGHPAQALAAWRRALDRAPDHPALGGTVEAMGEVLSRALLDAEQNDAKGGIEHGAGKRSGAVSGLALALSWRTLPWTEETRALISRVADLAADQGVPRAALSLIGETAAPQLRARWQLLAGEPAGALATLRSDGQAKPEVLAALAAGRLDEALAMLGPPNHDGASANDVTGSTATRPGDGEGAAGTTRPRGDIAVPEATPRLDEAPGAAAGIGHATPGDTELMDAAVALEAVDGPPKLLGPKLAGALTTLREALDDSAKP